MLYTDPTTAARAVAAQIAQANHVLVLTHVNPDGDAIGSLMGVTHVLRALGKQVTPMPLSPLPQYAAWLPGLETARVYASGTPLPADIDLIFVVDTASIERLGRVYPEHAATLDGLPMIVVDHHVTNDGRGTLNLIQPSAASACELLYALFAAMGAPITPAAATCLLLGLTTDTQSFQTSATVPDSLRAAAALIDLGADQQRITSEVYYALPAPSALLIGQALAVMHCEGGIAWAHVSNTMMVATGAEEEAADEVVRVMQRIGGVQALVLFKERGDGTTKISLRSRPPYDVAALAQTFGGGGHKQASGATLNVPPAEAETLVLPRLRAMIAPSLPEGRSKGGAG